MRAINNLAMIDAMPLQYIQIFSVNLSQILIALTLRMEVTLLAMYRGAFFLDIV